MRRWLNARLGLGLILVFALVGGWAASQSYAAPLTLPAAAPRVALPAVDVGGDWTTQVSVQNLGAANTYAVLELYPRSYDACAGATATQAIQICLGEIKGGQARTVTVAGVPSGAYSGYVVAYSDCPGGGAPNETPLAVVVGRERMLPGALLRTAASAYTALVPDLSAYNPETNRYTYYAPHVRANLAVDGTTLALQNVGPECASVKVSFFDESYSDELNCFGVAGTVEVSIAPNTAARVISDQADLPVFFGNALIESTQPLAVTVDVTVTNHRQMLTYTAVQYTPAEQRLIFPLVLSFNTAITPFSWLTNLKVQNTSIVNPSLVTERLYNRDGSVGSSVISQNLCPGASRLLQVIEFSPAPDFVGSGDVQNGAAVALLTNTAVEQFEGYTGIPPVAAGARLGLPRLRRQLAGGMVSLHSYVMVRNVNPFDAVNVTLTLYDETGNLVDSQENTIERNGATVFDLAGYNFLGNSWRGSGVLTASGSANPRIVAVVLERGSETGADTSRTYVASRIGLPNVTPAPSRTPTRTETPTPSATPTEPSTPVATATPTATPQPTVVSLTPPPNVAGYVVSLNPNTNFLTAGEIYVGSDRRPLKPIQWVGALQFDVSSIPDTADLLSAEVILTGKTAVYLDGASGIRWEMQLLDKSVDAGWTTIAYNGVTQAAVDDRLTPTYTRDELGAGVVNTFTFTPQGLAALRERLQSTNRVSLRITATEPPTGYRAIFTWDSGNGTGRDVRDPVLRLTYR